MSDPEASPGLGPSEGAHISARCSLRHPFLDRLQNNANPTFAQAFIFQLPGVLFPAASATALALASLSPTNLSRLRYHLGNRLNPSIFISLCFLALRHYCHRRSQKAVYRASITPHLRLLPSAAADSTCPHQLSTRRHIWPFCCGAHAQFSCHRADAPPDSRDPRAAAAAAQAW